MGAGRCVGGWDGWVCMKAILAMRRGVPHLHTHTHTHTRTHAHTLIQHTQGNKQPAMAVPQPQRGPVYVRSGLLTKAKMHTHTHTKSTHNAQITHKAYTHTPSTHKAQITHIAHEAHSTHRAHAKHEAPIATSIDLI